jgi:hypothetical protein
VFIRSSWLVCAMGNCGHIHNSAMNDTVPQEPLKASTTSHTTLRLRKGATANINEIHQVACFGDVYCVIADKSPFYDCWSSEPVIMFYSDDTTRTFPRTDLPDTRMFLGAYVDHGSRRIVAANFKYEKPHGKTVNIYVYTVNDDFTCSLRHTLTNDADDCAGSCILGRLTSVHNSAFTLVYNDMANNSHTTVLTASSDDDSSVGSSVTVMTNSQFPPVLHDLDGVYFCDSDSFFLATAKRAVVTQPSIILRVCKVTVTDGKARGKDLVNRRITLPCVVPPSVNGKLRVLIQTMQSVEIEGEAALRCLVRVELCEPSEGATVVVAILVDLFTQCVLDTAVLGSPKALVFMTTGCDRIIQCKKPRRST